MLDDFQRVHVLSEALPFIQEFYDSIIVVKYGGSVMQNNILKRKVAEDILLLSYIGMKLVVIHGGGPTINFWLNKLNINTRFKNGVRVTDKATMEIVEMALIGKVNQELVALINSREGKAIGLSGKDAKLITASRYFNDINNFVGKIETVNSDIVNLLVDEGYIPVIASVAVGIDGQSYNINADTVAGAIAADLSAEKLILLTDTPGIMENINQPNSLFRLLSCSQIEKLKKQKIIAGGMIPKVNCCIEAIKSGVKSAHIIDGRVEHALLLEILTKDGIGSMLV